MFYVAPFYADNKFFASFAFFAAKRKGGRYFGIGQTMR